MVDTAQFEIESTALLPTLSRICMSILHSDADAQDAVQQALANAWASRSRIDPARYRAWLTRIAINECRNIQRYRMRVVPVEEMQDAAQYSPPDIDLADAVHALDEKLRTPLLLKYMEGYSVPEIAQVLQISVPAVKNRLYRARRAVGKHLAMEVTFQ